ncbi:uncharacterized protein LOC120354060 isoform X1 [Nilaparvata lugens]|uniref:uncharacterized protein LOC120354060 isoform X1 n=1 Tax=Nilaparvata lugens TaxID=108931 RepID=UPI00193E23BF|nr:uncharacterized protein LOC120354060 isoform X1 [Nilaparvata lugens]
MSLRLDFVDKWTVDQYRDALDTDEQWDLKRSFMLAHCESFPVERLLYFTEIFCNITFKMCPYPVSIMTRIEEMSKDVFTSKHAVLQNRFYKTLVEVLRSEPQSHIKRATGYNETRQQSEKTHDNCTSSFTNRNQDFLYDQESDSRNIAELNIQSSKTSSIKRGGVLQNSSPIREDRGCSILDRAFHTIYGDYTFHEDESECVDDFSMTPNFQSISSKSLISLHISKNHEEKILEYHSEMFREAVVKDNSSIGKRDNDLPLENHCQLQNPLVTDNMIERIKSIPEEHCQSKNPLTTSKTSVLPAYDIRKSTSLNNTNLESINIRLEEDNGINPDHFDCESRVDTGISDDEADEPLVTKLISYPILSSLSFDLSSKIRSMKRDRNSRSDQKVHESRKNNHKEERSDRACKKDGRSDSRELGRYSPERGHHSRKYKSPERRQHTRKYKSPERGLHSRKDKSLERYSDRNKFRKLDNDDRSMKRRRDDSTHRRSPVSRHNKLSRNSNISYDDERRRRKDRDSPTSGEYDEQRSLNDRRLEPRSLFRRHSNSDSDNDGRDCRSRRRLEKDSEFHRDRDRRLKEITDTDRLSYEQRSGSVGMDYQPQANFHQPQPDYHQPQPNSYQPPVNFHQPLGNFHQPETMYPQPQSMYPQSQSMYPQPQPMYPQPQPMYPQPQSMYPQPQPMYPQPMYPQSQANFHQPQSNLYQPQPNFHNSHLSGGMPNWGQTMPSQATLMGKGQNSKLPPGKSAITSSHAKAVPIKVQNADVNILKQVSTTQNPGLNEVAKLNEIKTIAALNTILTCGGIPLNFNPSILPNVSLNLPFQNRTKIPSKPVCYKHTPTVTQTSKKNKVKPPTSQNQKTSGNVSSSAATSKPVVSPAPSRNMKNPSPSQNKNKTTIKTVSPNTPTLSISSNKRKLTDDFGEISNWLITVDDDEGDYGISSEKKLKLDKQDSDKWKIGLSKESVKFYVEANMRPYLKSVLEITLQDVRQRAGPLGSVAIICLKNEQAKKTLLRLNHLLENFKLKIVHETHACGENTTWTCRIDACCTNSNKVSQICVAEAPNKHEAEKAVCDRVLWYLQHIYFTFFFVKLEPNRPNEVKTCDIVLRRLCEYGFTQKLPPNFLDDTNYCTEVPFTTADDKKTYFTALKDFAKSVTMSSEGYKFIHFSPKISIGTNESLMNVANSLSLFSRWKGDKDSGLLVFRLTRKMYWDFVKVMFDRPFVYQKMPSNFVFNFHIMRPHQTSAKYGPINLMTQNTDDETKKNDKETIEETKKTNEETEKTIEETKKTNKETEKTNFETKTVDVRTCEPVVAPAANTNMKKPSLSQNKTTIETVSPKTPTLSISSNKRKLADAFGETSNWVITVDDDEGDYGISSEKKPKLDKQDSDKWKIGLSKESVKFYVEVNMRPYLKSVHEITLQDVLQRAGPLGSIAIMCLKDEQAKKTLLRLNYLLQNLKLKIMYESHKCRGNTQWTCRIDACCTNSNKVTQICVAEAPTKHEAETAVCTRVLWYLQHIYFSFFFVKLEPNITHDSKTGDFVLRRFCEYGFRQKLPPNFLDNPNYCKEVPFTTAGDKYSYFAALKDFAKSVTMSSEGYKFIHFSPKLSEATNERLKSLAACLSLFSRWKSDKDSGIVMFRLTRKMYWDFVKVMLDRPPAHHHKIHGNFVFEFHVMKPHQTIAKYRPINLITRKTNDETKKNNKETKKTNDETKKTNDETNKKNEESNDESVKNNEETKKPIEKTKKTNDETYKNNEGSNDESVKNNEETKKPIEKTKKTNDETKKTNDETKKTNDETKKTNETKKMNDETKKMNDETQKMNDETKKKNDETQKMDDETKKTNDETKETNDETRKNNLETNDEIEKNDEETKKPIEETKKPIEETKKPIEETKKNNEPTNDEIGKNNEETKKPIEETKKTNDETKKNNEETIDEIEENNEENKKLIEETKKTNDETKKNYESEKNNEETKKPFEESKKTNDKTKKKIMKLRKRMKKLRKRMMKPKLTVENGIPVK